MHHLDKNQTSRMFALLSLSLSPSAYGYRRLLWQIAYCQMVKDIENGEFNEVNLSMLEDSLKDPRLNKLTDNLKPLLYH